MKLESELTISNVYYFAAGMPENELQPRPPRWAEKITAEGPFREFLDWVIPDCQIKIEIKLTVLRP